MPTAVCGPADGPNMTAGCTILAPQAAREQRCSPCPSESVLIIIWLPSS
jgi:hypothetical protein